METGQRWSVGVTASLDWPQDVPYEELPPGVTRRRTRLSEIVDTEGYDATGCAQVLLVLADAEAQIAAFRADVVKRFADLRPDLWDLNPDDPAAKVEGWGSARTFNGVTEFFTDEVATVLGISRTRADTLANFSLVLREQLLDTWEALADGRIDPPRAQALVKALGWQAPTVDPDIVAAVEREALQWAIQGEGPFRLQDRASALLLKYDSDAADRRRKEAKRLTDVTVRNQADGMADFVVRMPAEVTAAGWDTCDTYARMRKAAGDDRPIGQLRALVAADLLLRPWDTSRESVTAHLTVFAPLPSLLDARLTAARAGFDGGAATGAPADPAPPPGARGHSAPSTGPGGGRSGDVTAGAGKPSSSATSSDTTSTSKDHETAEPQGAAAASTEVCAQAAGPTADSVADDRAMHRPSAHYGWAEGPPEVGWIGNQPITAAHLHDVLTQLDAFCPGGLQAPAGGSLDIALTDPDTGALRAVVTRHQLEQLVRHGCPGHPDPHPRTHARGSTGPPPGTHLGGAARQGAGTDPTGGRAARPNEYGTPMPPATGCACPVLDAPQPTDTYRPTAAQQRFINARDRTCRHPGCTRPARWTDADHVIAHADGGPTACTNLCRRHHRLKTHAPGWTYSMTPDGQLSVTTPSGITRTSAPPGTHHRLRPDDLLHPLETSRPPAPEPAKLIDYADDPPPF